MNKENEYMDVPEKKHYHRKSHRKSHRHEKSIAREFRVEITIGFIFLLGVFLLFEKMEIKAYVFYGVVNTLQAITQGFSHLLTMLLSTTDTFEVSDIVGTILILLAFLLFYIFPAHCHFLFLRV